MLIGQHLIKSWSSTQPVIALSSAEAELYALVKGATQAVGLASMLQDLDVDTHTKIYIDSSAAFCITHRAGLGKTRHIQTQYLWVQDKVQDKSLGVSKVHTQDNPADILTKHLKEDTMNEHIARIRARLHDVRSSSALKLNRLTADRWQNTPSQWIRIHNTPRRTLFTPMQVSGGPMPSGEVGKQRVTYGVHEDGETFTIKDSLREREF